MTYEDTYYLLGKKVKEMDEFYFNDPRKRAGAISNLCQIWQSLAKKGIYQDLLIYKSILERIKSLSDDYTQNIKPRDFSDFIFGFCNLYKVV